MQNLIDTAIRALAHDMPVKTDASLTAAFLEVRMIDAVWTLRRMPDREAGLLYSRQILWPDMKVDRHTAVPAALGRVAAAKRIPAEPRSIDLMQPVLDLLRLLPDVEDRRIVFWGAWHQDGVRQERMPWAKVRRSLSGHLGAERAKGLSRWTLKRRYDDGLGWIARLLIRAETGSITDTLTNSEKKACVGAAHRAPSVKP
ncbi:hypothetical protein [Gimibacter soli]|uniref:Uncharacterized protein n=1 Tax=Gimibacter soli TaxID=3024400 RepID=A0AAF0BMW2_9PROT|nr:hypothetical protein [Gimibacter soli]WCL55081.1 hypothetical protein PH603_04825 [Gimibacter soli]